MNTAIGVRDWMAPELPGLKIEAINASVHRCPLKMDIFSFGCLSQIYLVEIKLSTCSRRTIQEKSYKLFCFSIGKSSLNAEFTLACFTKDASILGNNIMNLYLYCHKLNI